MSQISVFPIAFLLPLPSPVTPRLAMPLHFCASPCQAYLCYAFALRRKSSPFLALPLLCFSEPCNTLLCLCYVLLCPAELCHAVAMRCFAMPLHFGACPCPCCALRFYAMPLHRNTEPCNTIQYVAVPLLSPKCPQIPPRVPPESHNEICPCRCFSIAPARAASRSSATPTQPASTRPPSQERKTPAPLPPQSPRCSQGSLSPPAVCWHARNAGSYRTPPPSAPKSAAPAQK